MPVAAANNDDDGFVWLDANTKIKLKPVGAAAPVGSAATGASAPEQTPEPAKKPAKKKRKAEK